VSNSRPKVGLRLTRNVNFEGDVRPIELLTFPPTRGPAAPLYGSPSVCRVEGPTTVVEADLFHVPIRAFFHCEEAPGVEGGNRGAPPSSGREEEWGGGVWPFRRTEGRGGGFVAQESQIQRKRSQTFRNLGFFKPAIRDKCMERVGVGTSL
jgi:hypothetical protein